MLTNLTKQELRELSIDLLDDPNGINGEAYKKLHTLLQEAGQQDVLDKVDASNGRYYIGETDAESLRLTLAA